MGLFSLFKHTSLVFSLFCFFLGTAKVEAAKKPAQDAANCVKLLGDEDTQTASLGFHGEVHTLQELLHADPKTNLAYQHPWIAMGSYQRFWHVIRHFGKGLSLDPVYRVEKVPVWHAFHSKTPEGLRIVDQYEAVDKVVNIIQEGASGSGNGRKMVIMRGPAGTGKTLFLQILFQRGAHLSLQNPDFYNYSFRWVNLAEVPRLAPMFDEQSKNFPYEHQMGRSPIVLLPPRLQRDLISLVSDRVREFTGYAPQPFLVPDPQTQEIMEAIVAHHFPGRKVSEREFVDTLSHYVQIFRVVPDPRQPPPLLRNQGRDPELDKLFFMENIFTNPVYGPNSALSYFYNGKVLRSDGSGLLADEFFRNPTFLRELFLDVAENRVVERGGAPSVQIDSMFITADNDESIGDAEKNSPAKAQLDRGFEVPWRSLLNPYSTAFTAMHMFGENRFLMRDLDSDESEVVPADLDVLFPEPALDGKRVGSDDRYEIYINDADGNRILVAPRALHLMALTAVGTRLVTDPKLLIPYRAELDWMKGGANEYLDLQTRLRIILGDLQANRAILLELRKLQRLLHEGQNGISARKVSVWLLIAAKLARENGNTLTPAVMDRAFELSLEDDQFKPPSNDIRARWVAIHESIKAGFLLPLLAKDIQAIISGDSDNARRIYEQVKQEIIALAADAEANEYSTAGGQIMLINKERMERIRTIYQRINHRELIYTDVTGYHINARDTERHGPLMAAIEAFLVESELDTHALDELLEFFERGQASGATRTKAELIRAQLARHGYNDRALMEAMRLVRDLRIEQQRREAKQ